MQGHNGNWTQDLLHYRQALSTKLPRLLHYPLLFLTIPQYHVINVTQIPLSGLYIAKIASPPLARAKLATKLLQLVEQLQTWTGDQILNPPNYRQVHYQLSYPDCFTNICSRFNLIAKLNVKIILHVFNYMWKS